MLRRLNRLDCQCLAPGKSQPTRGVLLMRRYVMDDLKLGGCETDLEGNPELGALVVHW